jgi:hypothetical protein
MGARQAWAVAGASLRCSVPWADRLPQSAGASAGALRARGLFGTLADAIDRRRDRALLCLKRIDQPRWSTATALSGSGARRALAATRCSGPSATCCRGGGGGELRVASAPELRQYWKGRCAYRLPIPGSDDQLSRHAREIELDAAVDGRIVASTISEFIEDAGVHS